MSAAVAAAPAASASASPPPAAALTSPSKGAATTPASAASPSPGAAAAAGASPGKAKAGAKLTKTQPIAAPVEEEKIPVFKGNSRAKKIFALFDHDKDKFLNRREFEEGLKTFVNAPDLNIDHTQIDALWLETDLNKDDKISWAEFHFRFCGGPHPNTLLKKQEKKLSLHLQTPRKRELVTGRGAGAINELKAVLEASYDGPKPRYKEVDFSKIKQMKSPDLKKLLGQILAAEKAEVKATKRPMEEWAVPLATGPGIEQKNVDKLFNYFNSSRQDFINLSFFFEQLKLRPSKGGNAKSKKKSKKDNKNTSGPQAYTLTTVKPEHVRDFISEQILKYIPENQPPNANSVKCHPALKHWGDDERKKKALNTEGYRTIIFLSERTKIKAVVKLAPPEPVALPGSPSPAAAAAVHESKSPKTPKTPGGGRGANVPSSAARSKSAGRSASSASSSSATAGMKGLSIDTVDPVNHSDVLIFAAFRTEYTAMARTENLYHARITMDEDEVIKKVEIALKKNWVDGELDKCSHEPVFEDWQTFVGLEDDYEELSIPPIA